MAMSIINDLTSLNPHIQQQEALNTQLSKTRALVQISLSEDFLDYDKSIINNYLWMMSDSVDISYKLSEEILNFLLQNYRDLVSEIEEDESIFKVIGFSDWEAKELQLRSAILNFLLEYIKNKKLSSEEASRFFSVEINTIDRILSGRIDSLGMDLLLSILGKIEFTERKET
ncbi:MAG: hypothetical protein JSS53_09830 [Proteobacteria bacterium]|nr:hypothetical protein [Pseudomonadota bacterium]